MKPFAFLPSTLMLGALMLSASVAAQTDSQTHDQAPAQSGPCQAQPQNGQQQKPPVNNGAGDSLTATLDPCNGVLLPPPTGDQGMAAPPPDQGKTPVLKPGEVPAQPPNQ
ncbi:MAG: hypothetical protein EOR30_09420 [Mesorhizobium sp.]|uniref:hypothetical protein n=1 Tax=unclassified Mesorhizobium TaxID=325217 RepID=UPI000FCC823A|nr:MULTISPECIES: hypothetical protein [unclassified Mesorhizobium]RUV74230.1 hypothetical protein EOA78_09875 [Mesorhizobium sp. M5C.F.Cr.IN.023.01.1.1]RWF87020.1 MAG: hypothetical protein EOQ36_14610 [Mesorhizobium sp.]RWF90960.1 MAG: hypothetical protein EOQ45_27950 [Mesorhizobium sp.]RWI43492.1 MAG: hypothetical protein EOR14_02620 [Mesorhizobium sp.]RWI47821.1 MAG: hypothetical protein EOR15_15350 [Mesorhizobium sp.]